MRVIHLVGNKVWGGGEQYVYDIAEALEREDKFSPMIICKDIKALNDRFSELRHTVIQHLPLGGYLDISSIRSLARILHNEGKCIVHAHDFERAFIALTAKRLSGNTEVRVIMTRHLISKGKNSLIRHFIYQNIDKILFVSQLALKEFLSTAPNIVPEKYAVLHNGVKDSAIDSAVDICKNYHLNNDTLILMYHGRIVPEKGVDVILDALKKINTGIKWHMFFAGTGNEQYILSLQEKCKAYNINDRVEWLGFLRNVHAWISECDCGVTPSVWQEPFGLAMVDYMMAGKPVITTNNGAQPEYIQDKVTGLLIQPGDAEALANAIISVNDAVLRQRIGTSARDYYNQHLSFDIFYTKLKEYYEQ